MNDNDIHAFGRPAAAPAQAPRPSTKRWRLWPWFLGAALVLGLLILLSGWVGLAVLADHAQHGGHVTINGQDWDGGDLDGLAMALGSTIGGVGVLLAAALVLLVVPLCLLVVLLALGLGVGLALAAALLAIALSVSLVVGMVLAPLWLTFWLTRRMVRALRRTQTQAMPAQPAGVHSLG
jgi:uncharacterized BrkB/YihY/UPF0761 family membrane protein